MPLILEAFKVLFYAALLLFFVGLAVSVFRDGIRACTNKNAQGGAIGDVLLTLVVVNGTGLIANFHHLYSCELCFDPAHDPLWVYPRQNG